MGIHRTPLAAAARRAAPCFACMLFLSSASCARSPILVGFSGSITGKQSALGLEGKEAVRLAVDEANAAGGVHGRPLALVVRDDAGDAEAAARNQRELEALGAVAVIGPSTSAMCVSALAATPGSSVPIVGGTVSSSDLAGKRDRFFRVINHSLRELEKMTEVLLALEVGVLLVVEDGSNAAYATPWTEQARSLCASAGIRFMEPVVFDSREPQVYGALAARVMEGLPGGEKAAVGIVAGGIDTALIAQALRKRGYAGMIASSAWGKTPDLLEHGGAAVEGVIFIENYDVASTSPPYLAFAAEYERRYGRLPNFSAVNHYEAALFLVEGLGLAKPGAGPGELLSALATIRHMDGLQGPIEFDECGDAMRTMSVIVVRNGEFCRADYP